VDYGVTRGWFPQGAGSPSLKGGGTAAAVPPDTTLVKGWALSLFLESMSTLFG